MTILPQERRLSRSSTWWSLFAPEGVNERPTDLVVVGDTGVDFFVSVPGMPTRDSKAIGAHLGIYGGGMAANFATAAVSAAPELAVRLISRVGSDEWGRRCLDDLRSSGLDVSAVTVQEEGTTWWCAVALDESGEKALLGGRTTASLPKSSDLDVADFAAARWIHLLGDLPFAADAMASAASAGAVTSVDIEASFAKVEPERAFRLIAQADLSILNREALRILSPGPDTQRAAVRLIERSPQPDRPRALVVTAGRSGSLLLCVNSKGRWSGVAQPASQTVVIDSTGAGDTFAGTFVGMTLRAVPLVECLHTATRAATRTLKRVGARSGRLDKH